MQHLNTLLQIILITLCAGINMFAQMPVSANKSSYFISGIVRDSVTYDPLPFASVATSGSATGALTNESGIFELTIDDRTSQLQISCLGYEKAIVPIKKNRINLYDIKLRPTTTELQELVVRKKKYSKKNNPAVDFVNSIRNKSHLTDPENNQYYNYDKHQVTTIALNDFGNKEDNAWMAKKFPFLWDHIDTSEVSGKPILNLLVKEKTSQVHYRKKPKTKKEVIKGLRQEGIDVIAEQDGMSAFFDEVMREIDLYDNDINLLNNRFVSPLSKIAPDFYKFYLTDTVEIEGEKCIVLSFYPHNPAAFGFNGQVYVPVNDSTMFIKKVTMRTPKNINLNFINNLFISQEFEKAPNGSRLKKRDDMTAEVSVVSSKSGLYARRNIAYDNHNFDAAPDTAIYTSLATVVTEKGAKDKDSIYWEKVRIIDITENEKNVNQMFDKMRAVPIYYWTEKVLKIIGRGYVETGSPSKFDFGPLTSTISHNHIEGWRLRAGGLTTAALSKRWFARGYVAYGLGDHQWKYNAEMEYSFIDKEHHSREFPIQSIKISSLYDLDQLGQHYINDYNDNIFLSLRRMQDNHYTYHRVNKLEYVLELANHFSFTSSIKHEVQYSNAFVPFVDGYGKAYKHFPETSLNVKFRYAPNEKFYQTRSHREPINRDALVLTLSHSIAPKGWFGSTFAINATEASIEKRLWFSAFGYTDVEVKGGHVWSKTPFTSLLIPNANTSYVILRENYDLMNPMEFINDTYASLCLCYHANGAILNYIPLVKKLKLRELFTFKGLWGHLSRRNDPAYNPSLLKFPDGAAIQKMTDTPYMEVSVGLDNIFKLFRVDYVWRLTYLNVPYKIDKSGLRIAAKVTF